MYKAELDDNTDHSLVDCGLNGSGYENYTHLILVLPKILLWIKATCSDSFRQVLKFMKSCFYSIDTWGATNEQAVNL